MIGIGLGLGRRRRSRASTSEPRNAVVLLLGDSMTYVGSPIDSGVDVGATGLYQYAVETGGTGTADTLTALSGASVAEPLGLRAYAFSPSPDSNIGHTVAWGRAWLAANPGSTLTIVPYGIGGASFRVQYNPDTGTELPLAITHVQNALTAVNGALGSATFIGAHICLGTNDLLSSRPFDEIRSNINLFVPKLRNSGIAGADTAPIVFVGASKGTYTTNQIEGLPAWNASMSGTVLKNMLESIGAKFSNVAYADTAAIGDVNLVHWTAAEQRTVAALIEPARTVAAANDALECKWDIYDTPQIFTGKYTFSNGDKTFTSDGTGAWTTVRATVGKESGKLYFEYDIGHGGGNTWAYLGLASARNGMSGSLASGANPQGCCIYPYAAGDRVYVGTDITKAETINLTTLADGHVFGFAVDLDTGKAWVAQNGTWLSGDPEAGTNPLFTWTPATLGMIWPAAAIYSNTLLNVTLVPDEASQTYGPPTGFSEWQPVPAE